LGEQIRGAETVLKDILANTGESNERTPGEGAPLVVIRKGIEKCKRKPKRKISD